MSSSHTTLHSIQASVLAIVRVVAMCDFLLSDVVFERSQRQDGDRYDIGL